MLGFRFIGAGLVFLFGSASILTAAEKFPQLNIFGNDEREDIRTRDTYPYAAIGQLDDDCTGTLVGTRLVLTAAHCIVDSSSGAVRDDVSYFRTNLLNGLPAEKAAIERAWVGTHNPEEMRDHDWAILKLATPMKAAIRPLTLETVDFAKAGMPYRVDLAGYSMDRNNGGGLSVHHGCSVRKAGKAGSKSDRPVFFEDCDSYAGISGAPLFVYHGNDAVVVGLAVSEFRSTAKVSVRRDEYSDDYANVAIAVSEPARVLATLATTAELNLPVPPIDGAFEVEAHGPIARVCRSYNGGAVAGVGYNPAISDHDAHLVDWTDMEKYAKDNSTGATGTGTEKTWNDSGLQKLSQERGGPAWGLTQQQCMQTLRVQKNGLICGAGLAYVPIRVSDNRRLGGNEYGYAFYSLEECQRAVTYSTPRYVCARNGLLNYSAFSIADASVVESFRQYQNNNALDECLTYIAQHP